MSDAFTPRFDPSCSYVASGIRALDSHQIRVQSVAASATSINSLFTLAKSARLVVLEWINSSQIAACLADGSVLIYEPASNSIVKTLTAPSGLPPSDFHVSDLTHTAWHADATGHIYEWDLQNWSLLQTIHFADMLEVAEPVAKLASVLYKGEPHLVVGTHNIHIVDIFATQVVRLLPAHVAPIVAIERVSADVFVTAADGDRFANMYQVGRASVASGVLVAQLPIRRIAAATSATHSVFAALTETGVVELFNDFTQQQKPDHEKPRTKKQRAAAAAGAAQSRHSDAQITYLRPAAEIRAVDDAHLPVAAVSLHNTTLHALWLDASGVAHFDAREWLHDQQFLLSGAETVEKPRVIATGAAHTVGHHDVAAARPYSEAQSIVADGSMFQPAHEARDTASDDESLAERLAALSEEHKTRELAQKRRLRRQTAGSLAIALTQALRSADDGLLQTVLDAREPQVVQRTLERLDAALAVQLLDRIAEKLVIQQDRFAQLNFWLKWVVVIHGTVMASMPNLQSKLANVRAVLSKKANLMPRLLELQGRLTMVREQNALKREIMLGAFGLADGNGDDDDDAVEYVEEIDDAGELGEMSDEDMSSDDDVDGEVDDFDDVE